MKISYPAVLLMMSVLAPAMGRCQGMPDLSTFPQPESKCMKPSAGLMITQVGHFIDPQYGYDSPLVEVVATVRPDTAPHAAAEFDHAAIQIYGTDCHLIYLQQFPGAGEATFKTMHWNSLTLLHLVTMSAVGEPADDVIYNHIILMENYDGSFFPVQPPFLTADKSLSIFFGDIGEGKGFGIVETFQQTLGPRSLAAPLSIMFQLKDVQLPEGEETSAFVGPAVIRAPRDKDAWHAWPDTSYATGFPLMHYLYGKGGGG
jgi:hypothetical protein